MSAKETRSMVTSMPLLLPHCVAKLSNQGGYAPHGPKRAHVMMGSPRGCAWTMKGPRRSDPSPVATMPAPAAPAAVHFRNSLRETRRHRFSESRTHFSAFSPLTRSHLLAQDAVPFGVEAPQTQIEGSLAASIGLGGRGMQCGRMWC